MGGWWLAWWVGLAFAPLVPWLNQTVVASGRLSWAAWALAAACLSLLEETPRRRLPLGAGAALIFLAFLLQLTVILPTVRWVQWTYAWETVAAFGSVVCWMIPVVWGTQAALRHSPRIDRLLPAGLFLLLSFNLAVWIATTFFGFRWWYFAENPGGAFQNATVWAGFCAVSLPLLWAWKRWAALPAVAGLLIGQSFFAYLALAAGILWGFRKRRGIFLSVAAAVVFLAAFRILAFPGKEFAVNNVGYRIHTWAAVVKTIIHNPFGIGFSPDSFMAVARSASGPILPHAASDVLRCVLDMGWGIIPLFGWIAWRGVKRLGDDSFSVSIVVFSVLSCVQSSLSIPPIGMLAWAVWMAWRIREADSPESILRGDDGLFCEGVAFCDPDHPEGVFMKDPAGVLV